MSDGRRSGSQTPRALQSRARVIAVEPRDRRATSACQVKISICSPVELRLLAPFFTSDATTLPIGLSSTVVTLLIAALLDRGHELTLFTLSRDVEREVVLRGPRLTAFVGKMRSRGRARNLWADEMRYLTTAIERERPSFVHAHWTYEFALAALRSGAPTLTTIHDLPWNVLRYFRDPYRAARVWMAYRVALRGHNYTAVSEDAARHFRRYFNPFARITVVPNFLSDSIFAQGLRLPDRSSAGLTYCTILQGWSTRKNGRAALQAFALVQKQLPTARLLMIGTDYQLDGPAHAWAKEHGLDTQVDFRGPLPYREMLQTFQAEADVLVHPSLDESFSMAALEGMVLGKPVIAGASTPGVREVLEFGKAGLLVDVRQPSKIADAMTRLGLDPPLRAAVAGLARDSACRRFRADQVVSAYEALYEEQERLANGHGRGSAMVAPGSICRADRQNERAARSMKASLHGKTTGQIGDTYPAASVIEEQR